MEENKNHPVYEVYDCLRTERLNVKFYSYNLKFYERCNFWMEVILALTVSSSAFAGLAVWNFQYGKICWLVLTIISTILAVMKPLLNWSDKIKLLNEMASSHKVSFHDIKGLVDAIKRNRKYDIDLQNRYQGLWAVIREISSKSPNEEPSKKLLERFQDEINVEIPTSSFFIPEE
jgi:hypothetical protein